MNPPHFQGIAVKPMTRWLLRMAGTLLLSVGGLHAQVITAAIDSITGPTGTSASPTYVIDSDATNDNFGYTRDKISVSASVTFTKNSANFSESKDFRLSVELIDVATNTAVTLEGGVTSQAGDAQTIGVNAFFPTTTATLTATVDPGVDLGAGKSYLLRVTVERQDTIFFNGFPLFLWLDADGPDDSTAFTVVHFMDGAAGAERFGRELKWFSLFLCN